MDITGKIVQLLPLQSGQGKNGLWRKQDYIIELGGQYPKNVCFNIWGDKIDTFQLKVGDEVKVDFDLESREFNGRWYTDVKAWNVSRVGTQSGQASAAAPAPTEADFLAQGPGTDLPF